MSLILEALRKSEAERRRAQVPDLLTEPQVAAPVAMRGPNRMPLIAAMSVVGLAAAWFVLRPSAPSTDTDAVAEAPATPPVEAKPATPAPAPAARAPELRRPLVVAAPTPAKPPQTTPATSSPGLDAPPATPIKPLPAAALAEAAPPPSPAPATDNTLRVSDLGTEDRKQLPPLKLSMHMWNQVATQRFVIIDGTRLGIGDHLGALVVSDIVPDGVVLDWNGRALKLPLR